MTFHVLKVLDPNFSRSLVRQLIKNAYAAIKGTDLVEYSAGNLRKNVDILSCYYCHTKGSLGKEFYKIE